MKKKKFAEYKKFLNGSINIKDDIIIKTSFPTIIFDKNFKVIFSNESALRLHDIPLNKMFMKNYFGIFCRSEDEYDEFVNFYSVILKNKEPVYVDNKQDNSYIMIFPLLSPETGEVEYFYNIFIVDEFHLTIKQKDSLRFSHDYTQFAHQLSTLLEAKDRYTANHSANVAKYSGLLGESLGLSAIELEKLKLAANLHDIGKVNIPNYILNKAGRLNVEEHANIKDHAYYSGKILEVFKELDDIREAGMYHHEMYNGRGYPFGLSGKNIPLNARIIAIADTFDAMTTDRPYRKALSFNEAITELKNNKNTQFDPFLVDKFVNLNIEKAMNSTYQSFSEYQDEFTVTSETLKKMRENIDTMFTKINQYDIIEYMVNYNFYGFIVSKVSKDEKVFSDNCCEILYESSLVDDLIYDGYLAGNWKMCLKEKKLEMCNHCPIERCLEINDTFFKKSKLTNSEGNLKYLSTLLHPIHNNDTNETFIFELLKDETLAIRYGDTSATEFFNFVDNLSRIFAEHNKEFSILYNEMRDLANWIALKVGVSEHKIELLNKALSICDLGIIALFDSNEFSFESLNKLRTNKMHIEVIYSMITKLGTFRDIKEIVLYHHTNYNDTSNRLSGEQIPIQSYVIAITDYLLTSVIMGRTTDETLKRLELASGTFASPLVCNSILQDGVKEELIEILNKVSSQCN